MHQKATGRHPETKEIWKCLAEVRQKPEKWTSSHLCRANAVSTEPLNLLGRVLVYTCHTDVNIQSSLFALENDFVYMTNYLVTLKTQKFNVTSDWQLILLFLILQNLVVFTVSKTEPHTPVLILDYSKVTWGVLDELAIGLRRGSKEVGKPDSCDIQFHSGLNAPVHLENLVCILAFLAICDTLGTP